ncbi:hypothetical protein pb186bvf_001420 [Paramecium bursaria]
MIRHQQNSSVLSYVDQVLSKSRNVFTDQRQPIRATRPIQVLVPRQEKAITMTSSPLVVKQEYIDQRQKQNERPQSVNQKIPLNPFLQQMENFKELKKNAKLERNFENPISKRPEERYKNFLILKNLGKGKYSEVYLAKHIQTGFSVALKVIKKAQILKEKMEAQLAWEIKIQYLLDHPNIVKLYTFFQTTTEIVLVLEYCPHGQLYDLLQQQPNKRFTEREAAIFTQQVTMALMYIHNNDVIHRDIKPENILLSYGQAKIADFSFCVYSPHEYRQTQCGTALYCSPEIMEGDLYDKRSDMWGLGVMTYELCFGVPPWKENQLEQIKLAQYLVPSAASNDLKDFIESLVKRLPRDRLSARQAINHPWLAQTTQPIPFFIKHDNPNLNYKIQNQQYYLRQIFFQKQNMQQVELNFDYLKPPAAGVETIVHEPTYIKRKERSKSQRKIWDGVEYDAYEKEKMADFQKVVDKAGIKLPDNWKESDTLKMVYCGKFKEGNYLKVLQDHLTWRANPNNFQPTDLNIAFLQKGIVYTIGRDKQYRPIIIMNLELVNLKQFSEETYQNALSYYFGIIRRYCFVPGKIENWIFIMDTKKLGLTKFPFKAIQVTTGCMQVNFCGCLDKLYLLNPSSSLSFSWKMVSACADSDTLEKIQVLKAKEFSKMLERIPINQLEEQYGGKAPNLKRFWPPVNLEIPGGYPEEVLAAADQMHAAKIEIQIEKDKEEEDKD